MFTEFCAEPDARIHTLLRTDPEALRHVYWLVKRLGVVPLLNGQHASFLYGGIADQLRPRAATRVVSKPEAQHTTARAERRRALNALYSACFCRW